MSGDGVLSWCWRVLHECKLLLAVSVALKILYVRVKEKDDKGELVFKSKDKKEALKRLSNMMKEVGVDKDLH